MKSSNKYESMSVLTALQYVKNKNMLLPDIQREYVWYINEIEELFESIVDDYPIGSCIFWKTNRKVINDNNPNLYYFLREFKSGESKNEKAPEVLTDETDYYIVLDGQQRITSMNIALNGSYTIYKGGRGRNKNNPNYWVTKELYYNLDFYNTSDAVDDEHPKKRFIFLSSNEAQLGNYYKVKNMLAFDKLYDFSKELIIKDINDKCSNDLSTLFERINDASTNGLIHYYCISENTYDEALDIFVRVNSTGKKLSKTDLLFSTLIDGWKNGRENIENLKTSMNSKGDGFNFTRDYLMRACLVLVDADANLRIKSLTQKTIIAIRNNWANINDSLGKMSDILAQLGLCDETISSYNATMPIAYYLYKGGKIETEIDKKEVRKFLSVSMAKRLFGVASSDALNSTRNALKAIDCSKTPFKLSLFSSITLTGGRTFKVDEKQDIDYWLDNYEKGQSTYILLSLLYPNLKLNQVAFHQDHCHPYAGFENKNISSLGLTPEKILDWQKKRNLLPNLQFLEGGENESKNKTPLKQWVEEGNDFAYHPEEVSLDLKDFDVFFEKRRELMKKELMKILDV